jgi:uncharacterized protein YcbX
MINGKVVGPLVRVVPNYDGEVGHLALRFPDGSVVEGSTHGGAHVTTLISRREVGGRIVEGPWSEALSELAGRSLRLVQAERPGDAADRGLRGGVSLVGIASLGALAAAAGVEQVDGRRFRMLFGVDGVPAHAEDDWVGRRLRIGDAVVQLRGNVGRCAVTTQDPETGVPDLDTLHVLGQYRGDVETSEPLPFGVWGEILQPGRVRLGDAVQPE